MSYRAALMQAGLLLLLSQSCATPGLTAMPEFEGVVTNWRRVGDMQTVRVRGQRGQLLVVAESSCLRFLNVSSQGLHTRALVGLDDTNYAFVAPGSSTRKRRAHWTTGDLDNDGADEVVVCRGRLLLKYRWDGGALMAVQGRLAGQGRQLLVGDVDSDGSNELLVCCDTFSDERESRRYGELVYRVLLSRWDETTPVQLWNDSSALGYGEPNMPDFFRGIGDYLNTGRNQVLVSRNQSDVSPTAYDLLAWDEKDAALGQLRSFVVSDSLRPLGPTSGRVRPYAIGSILPLRWSGTVLVKATVARTGVVRGDYGRVFREELLQLTGSHVRSVCRIFQHEGWFAFNPACLIDPDGNGTGVLRFWSMRPGEWRYRFYRLR